MRPWLTTLLVLGLVLTCSAPAAAQPASDNTHRTKSFPVVQPHTLRLPAVPLRTQGRWVVDSRGQRVKLSSINWFGAESPEYVVGGLDKAPMSSIARWVRERGFNSIRLPWSNELLERNPTVKPEYLTANPDLQGLRGMEILDRVVAAAAAEGLMVVLDNHRSRGDWCCDEDHGDGLWYSKQYPESAWLADWTTIVNRYRNQPAVVAAELRNELRPDPAITAKKPSWGDGDATTDWKRAAELGGNAVLAANPKLLVIVAGLEYQGTLEAAYDNPARLRVPSRLVYAAHDYAWFHDQANLDSYAKFSEAIHSKWGKILDSGHPATAPVYVSEYGTCASGECDLKDLDYIRRVVQYLKQSDADWAYWPVNGTQSAGYSRTHGDIESYGLLDAGWQSSNKYLVMGLLVTIQRPRQGPRI